MTDSLRCVYVLVGQQFVTHYFALGQIRKRLIFAIIVVATPKNGYSGVYWAVVSLILA